MITTTSFASPPASPVYTKYIVVTGLRDGIGSQIQAKLSGLAYCHKNTNSNPKFVYLHTPLNNVGHINGQQTKALEKFFNIEEQELHLQQINNGTIPVSMIPNFNIDKINNVQSTEIISTLFCNDQVESINPSYYYTQQFRDLIRQRYFNTPKPDLGRSPGTYHIALHLRRGDVQKQSHPNRWVENYEYVQVMSNIISRYRRTNTSTPIEFHVYSQGYPTDFSELLKCANTSQKVTVTLHLNELLEHTIHGMVIADELIMGRSSFSYVAALYNNGIVHYFPFWHRPLAHWNIVGTSQ